MRSIIEYLSANVKPSIIYATDYTIKEIVKDELDRLGHKSDLNHIDVSKVTNMDSLFSCFDLGAKYKDLNPDISKWNVSKVENMYSMFWNCENFNCDISQWDVSHVENMKVMFYWCDNFNQDLSIWDVSKVKNYEDIFHGCNIKKEYKPHFIK